MRIQLGNPESFNLLLKEQQNLAALPVVDGLSIDSRLVKENDGYAALVGARVDGHDFIHQAVSAGARLIISEIGVETSAAVVQVESTHETLKDLAARWRSKFKIPVIGITGTNGKTSTKELLHHVLSTSISTLKTEANFNSTIGLPLSILRLNESHKLAILEMGVSAPGEMIELCRMAQPTIGLITNIQPAHIQAFRTIRNIAKEKAVLFEYLPATGLCFVNLDDTRIREVQSPARQITYGFNSEAQFHGRYLESHGQSILKVDNVSIPLPTLGRIMAKNALAVYTIATTMGVSTLEIVQRIETFIPEGGRGEVRQIGAYTVIDDTYNANFESAKEGLQTFVRHGVGARHIVVMGDMLELGKMSQDHHARIGSLLSKLQVDAVFALGSNMIHAVEQMGKKKSVFHFTDMGELQDRLRGFLQEGDILYIKGSRSMRMERVITEVLAD